MSWVSPERAPSEIQFRLGEPFENFRVLSGVFRLGEVGLGWARSHLYLLSSQRRPSEHGSPGQEFRVELFKN